MQSISDPKVKKKIDEILNKLLDKDAEIDEVTDLLFSVKESMDLMYEKTDKETMQPLDDIKTKLDEFVDNYDDETFTFTIQRNRKLQTETERLQAAIKELSDSSKRMQAETESIETSLAQVQKEHDKTKKSVELLKENKKKLSSETKIIKKENDELRKQKSQLEMEATAQKEKLTSIMQKISVELGRYSYYTSLVNKMIETPSNQDQNEMMEYCLTDACSFVDYVGCAHPSLLNNIFMKFTERSLTEVIQDMRAASCKATMDSNTYVNRAFSIYAPEALVKHCPESKYRQQEDAIIDFDTEQVLMQARNIDLALMEVNAKLHNIFSYSFID